MNAMVLPRDEQGERIRLALLESSRARYEAERLETRAKMVLSTMVCHFRDKGLAVGESEHRARASDEYDKAVQAYTVASFDAGQAYAEAEAMKLRFEAWRTRAATRRAEMQLK